jgi:hypothetical protein
VSKCYVGFKSCGCAVSVRAIVGTPKEIARDVAKFIRAGLTVEIRDSDWLKENFKECKCPARAASEQEGR